MFKRNRGEDAFDRPFAGRKMGLVARASGFRVSTALYFLLVGSLNSQIRLPPDASKSPDFYCLFHPAQAEAPKPGVLPPPPNNTKLASTGDLVRDCDIYNRAEEMFLWVTSPSPIHKRDSYVFSSSAFLGVSPAQDGRRLLVPQSGSARPAGLLETALSKTGPNGVAVVFDSAGNPHDLLQPKWVLSDNGTKVEIGRTSIRPPASPFSPLLLDLNGKRIQYGSIPKTFDADGKSIVPVLNREVILAGGTRYASDANGNAIDYGVDQESHRVLMTQKGKLVYYKVFVNDVYARYYNLNPNSPPTSFPTKVEDWGRNLPDAEALAVALKTAWVVVGKNEAKEYKQSYLTIEAEIPIYKKSEYCWRLVKGAKQPARLALVGMHVAFAAQNQPGMIWATFEHVGNARNKPYQYRTDQGQAWHEDSHGDWLFSKSGNNNDVYNVPRMHVNKTGDIVGDGGTDKCGEYLKDQNTIGPSNIRREFAWGSENSNANTNLIDVNSSFIEQLLSSDTRRNYVLIGVTWYDPTTGATKLANSTMETFDVGSQCLECHKGDYLSHIWRELPK
jgi:hypothetical protein